MNFDLRHTPFSRYGSYIAFSHLPKSEARPEGLYMRTVHGNALFREVFLVELLQGKKPIPFKEIATPTVLRLENERGHVDICIAEPKLVRIKGSGVGIRLRMATDVYGSAISVGDHRWEVNSYSNQIKYMLIPMKGRLLMDAPWSMGKCDYIVADFLPQPGIGVVECAIEEFPCVWYERSYDESFDNCVKSMQSEYQRWLDKTPQAPKAYSKVQELAAYTQWSCVVSPEGHLTRPAMYMSKNWMTNVWSWDNCFNAMALVYKNPELAWDQFMLLIDNQDKSGVFPDSLNDKSMMWNFCKPPIHGWSLRWMMERTDFINKQRLKEVYEPLCRWTQWWFKYRDHDHDGIPQYNHGNDSGWDNSTVFDEGVPIEGPDLCAYLIIQMDTLSEIASKLGEKNDAKNWKSRADELLEKMLAHSWRGDGFVAPRSGDHHVAESDSLLLFLPIILGPRLPEGVLTELVVGLSKKGRFLTEHGLTTESLKSPLYQANGYWRGPIWAPSTMIIVEGLAAAAKKEFARKISRKFCDMVARSGMAENFDALTGTGLRDPAYTWTSSVLLILAHEYL